MKYTCTEIYSEKPISAWLTSKVEHYVREKHGLEIHVTVNPKYMVEDPSLKSPAPDE